MKDRTRRLRNMIPAMLMLCCISSLDAQTRVAVMGINSTPAWNQDVQHKLMATGMFGLVDVFDVSSQATIPSLSDMRHYDAVLVYSAADLAPADARSLGDVLAAYFENGGGLVDMAALNTQGTPIGGKFQSNYALLTPAATIAGGHLMTGAFTNLPLLKGVTSFDGGTSSFYSLGNPVQGANVVAFWTNNAPLVILGPPLESRRVTLNFFPVSSDVRPDFWSTETPPVAPVVPSGAFLMANALVYVVQPPRPPGSCTFNISPQDATVSAHGASGTVSVTASDANCPWTATGDAPWVHLFTAQAPGSADLNYAVDPNDGPARSTTLHIAAHDFALTQAAGNTAEFSLGTLLTNAAANRAFSTTVAVTAANPALSWAAVSNDPWITITSATPQTGSGTVSYSVALNPGPRRTGSMTIAGLTSVVIQGGANCFFSLSATSASVLAAGDSGRVTVDASSGGCPWTAVSDAPWITIPAGSSGTGSGAVNVNFAPNPSASPRVGVLTIALQTFRVTQSGVAALSSISPTSANFAAAGGPGSVALMVTPADATWNVASNAPWITITSGTAGQGAANITYFVAGNPSASPRTGTLTIAGLTFTVTQLVVTTGTFSLNPTSANAGAAGGRATVAVTATPSDAGWTAVSNAPWITITTGDSGVGNGTVGYFVAPNPSASPRVGTLTIASLTFTVTQAGSTGTGGKLGFYGVAPCRVADTRPFGGKGAFGPPSMGGGSTRDFPVLASGCGVPDTAQAYSLNITVVPAGRLTFLSIWPAGQPQPVVSTLNSFDGRVVANAAIVPAGTNGSISVFVSDATDVIIDINGYFAPPDSRALAFFPVTPCRVADTRPAGGKTGPFGPPGMAGGASRSFPVSSGACGIPPTAQAYSLNITAVPPGPLTFLTAWPAGQFQPDVSTLNAIEGGVVANAALVLASAGGAINIFVSDPSDVIIDINGYFALGSDAGALFFYPSTPCRLADTRGNGKTGAFGPPSLSGGATRDFAVPSSSCAIPSSAMAYSLNMTVIPSGPLGFLSTWPTGQPQPVVSTLNSLDGKVVANAAIVPAGTGASISVFAANSTDLIIDANGYFAP